MGNFKEVIQLVSDVGNLRKLDTLHMENFSSWCRFILHPQVHFLSLDILSVKLSIRQNVKLACCKFWVQNSRKNTSNAGKDKYYIVWRLWCHTKIMYFTSITYSLYQPCIIGWSNITWGQLKVCLHKLTMKNNFIHRTITHLYIPEQLGYFFPSIFK